MHLVIWITCFAAITMDYTYGESTTEVINKVKSGVEAGANIIKIFESKAFSSKISDFSEKLGPFLGAIGPAISIATMFLPQGESAELQFMREKFAKIDNDFERVMNQFGEVKQLIHKLEINSQYSGCERKIILMTKMLDNLLLKRPDAKNIFISNYRHYGDSTNCLYNGLMYKPVYGKNIIEAAIKYTENDRGKMADLMKDTMVLILKGVKIDLSYYKLKGYNYDHHKNEWGRKLNILFKHIARKDEYVKNQYESQSKIDIRKLMPDNYKKSNKKFAEVAYDHLIKKYYWRDWLIIVYNDIYGTDNHYGETCHGFTIFHESLRNYRIASVDKSKPKINQQNVWNQIGNSKLMGSFADLLARAAFFGRVDVKKMYKSGIFPSSLIATCKNDGSVATSGLIKTYANVFFGCKHGSGEGGFVEDGKYWSDKKAFWGGRLVVRELPLKQYAYVFG